MRLHCTRAHHFTRALCRPTAAVLFQIESHAHILYMADIWCCSVCFWVLIWDTHHAAFHYTPTGRLRQRARVRVRLHAPTRCLFRAAQRNISDINLAELPAFPLHNQTILRDLTVCKSIYWGFPQRICSRTLVGYSIVVLLERQPVLLLLFMLTGGRWLF